MKKKVKTKIARASWDNFDFSTPEGEEIRQEYWSAVNALRELAHRFDRDELMDEVNRDV